MVLAAELAQFHSLGAGCTAVAALAAIALRLADPDPETLLAELDAAEAETARLRDQLKAILAEALAR